jgi:hypothetical protein
MAKDKVAREENDAMKLKGWKTKGKSWKEKLRNER